MYYHTLNTASPKKIPIENDRVYSVVITYGYNDTQAVLSIDSRMNIVTLYNGLSPNISVTTNKGDGFLEITSTLGEYGLNISVLEL